MVRVTKLKVLKNDAKKAFDKAAYDQFAATPLKVAPTAGTATDTVVLYTNGTQTATNNLAMNKAHVKAIVDLMKERMSMRPRLVTVW